MKKLIIAILGLSIFYNSNYTAFANTYDESIFYYTTAYDPEHFDTENLYSSDISTHSASAVLGTLVIGGLSISVAPLTLATYLLGAVAIGVGSYFLAHGGETYSLDDIYKDMPLNLTSSDFEVLTDGSVEVKPSSSNKSLYQVITNSSIYKKPELPVIDSPVISSNGYTFINKYDGVSFSWFVYQPQYYQINFATKGDLNMVFPIYNSVGDFQNRYVVVNKGATSSTYIYNSKTRKYIFPSNQYKVYDNFGSYVGTSISSGYTSYPGYSFSTTGVHDIKSLFESLGIMALTDSELQTFLKSLVYSGIVDNYTVPLGQIALANPDLTYNLDNKEWVNSDGEPVDIKDVVIPLPNTLTQDGLKFDDITQSAIDNAIKGDTSTPDESLPDTGTWLSTVVNWLTKIWTSITSLPELIANAFSSMIGAITGTLTNIWEWCQSLPQTLSEWFQNVVAQLMELGLTLSDVLKWIISLPVELVVSFTGMLEGLFIPTDLNFSSVADNFNKKIPLIEQIKDLFFKFNFDYQSTKPDIPINIPYSWGGGVYYVDLTTYEEYRPLILSITRLFIWFRFLMAQYKLIPSDISGGGRS